MDSTAADYIRHRLEKFERAIDDTSLHFSELESFGTWYASAPYYEKCMIPSLLDSLSASDPVHATLMQEYLRIVQRLESFSNERGREYRDLLFQDLRHYTHAYHAAVCHAHLCGIGPDTALDIGRRDLIGELCRELQDDYDIAGIGALVAILDDNLPRHTGSVQEGLPDDAPWRPPDRNNSPADGKYPLAKKKTGHIHPE
jgi:hypothetical protein